MEIHSRCAPLLTWHDAHNAHARGNADACAVSRLASHRNASHRSKSQSKRDATAAAFRAAPAAVLCSSDVSARGVDYPDVTLVLQVGPPANREQYIHRLGRTGRAGKRGRGLLMLTPYETFVLRLLDGLPLADATASVAAPPDAAMAAAVAAAVERVSEDTRGMAYQAWLGYYNGLCKPLRWSKEELVARANAHAAAVFGLPSPPGIEAKTIAKMGLKGISGLKIIKGARSFSRVFQKCKSFCIRNARIDCVVMR
jgi:ATP-dependent RNA helicase MSS116